MTRTAALGCLILLAFHSGCGGSKGQFKLGMTVKDAQARMSRPYEPSYAGIAYLPDTSAAEYATTREIWIRVEDEGLDLFFNHYGRLIAIESVKKK